MNSLVHTVPAVHWVAPPQTTLQGTQATFLERNGVLILKTPLLTDFITFINLDVKVLNGSAALGYSLLEDVLKDKISLTFSS